MKQRTRFSNKNSLGLKTVPHDIVRRIIFWGIKSPEQDFQYLYSTISKKLSVIYLPVREYNSLVGSGGYMKAIDVLIRDKISFVGVAHLTRGGRSCSWALYRSDT